MQIQQKKIKGFSLLELLVVVLIIGLVSSFAFLPFQKWRSDRMVKAVAVESCLLYTSPSPRDSMTSRMPSSA